MFEINQKGVPKSKVNSIASATVSDSSIINVLDVLFKVVKVWFRYKKIKSTLSH